MRPPLAAVRHLLLPGLITALCLAPLPPAPVAAPADAAVVHAPATPAEGTVDLSFRELWRAGGEDDEDVILGLVARVLPGPDGQVLALDSQLSQVLVFGPDGSLLRTVGREGDGPGEVRNAGDLVLLPDGNLGILQFFPGRIVALDLQGNPAGAFTPGGPGATTGGFGVFVRAKCRDGRVGITGIAQQFAQGKLSQTRYLAVFAADGSPLDTVVTKRTEMDFSAPVLDEAANDFCWERWDFLPDGGVVVNPPRDAFRLEFHGPDGALRRVVTRDERPLARDEEELARNRAMLEAQGRFYPSPPRVVVAPTEPVVEGISVRDGGEVWVLTGRGRLRNPDGVLVTYDVFDTAGRFLRRVRIHADGDPRDDHLFLLDGRRVALVHGLRSASLASMGGKDDDPADAGDEEEEPAPLELIIGELVP